MNFPLLTIIIIVIAIITILHKSNKKKDRILFIERYEFSNSLKQKILKNYLFLSLEEIDIILQGLRDYFVICNKAEKKEVSMPSRAVDTAWHEFILHTKIYQDFCENAFGYFLHHTPAEGMNRVTQVQKGIKRVWKLACWNESLIPRHPGILPRLFDIDRQLNIPNGYVYSLESNLVNGEFSAHRIGCSAHDGKILSSDSSSHWGCSSCSSSAD